MAERHLVASHPGYKEMNNLQAMICALRNPHMVLGYA